MEKTKGSERRTVTFTYDPMGRRIGKELTTVIGGTTKTRSWSYVNDGSDIAMEIYTDENAVTTKTFYTQGPGTDEHLAMERNGSFYYYHADGLGSVTTITDAGRNVVQSYQYDSFGMVTPANDTFRNSYAYTGREWDEETGLYYYRARYYDPMEGRFISKDPISFAGGDVNLYGYVENNPVNWIDPLGLIEDSPQNLRRRQTIAETAKGYNGSHSFDTSVYGNWQYPADSYKCSYFVCTVLKKAGVPIRVRIKDKKHPTRCPTAGELAKKRWNPKNWRQLKPGERPLPGDIAAFPENQDPSDTHTYSGHSGIMVTEGGISAHSGPTGGVYVIRGQFELNPNTVYRRYTGE